MPSAEVALNFRVRGAQQSAAQVRLVSGSLHGVTQAAHRAGDAITSRLERAGSRAMQSLRYQAYGVGLTLSGLGIYAAKTGIQFNATMEQNRVAFTHFLGSAEKAKDELAVLYGIAAKTPFEFADVTTATRKFLAFGFTVKESNKWLMTLADAASGAGVGAEAIGRMTLAIGQIKSKGRLQMEEVRQLQELGVLNFADLAKNLGISTKELGNLGSKSIGSNRALKAIQKTLDDTFKGMSKEQAKTFTGQITTLRDYTAQAFGALTFPAFEALRRDVFPALTESAQTFSSIMTNPAFKHMDLAEKLELSQALMTQKLQPLYNAGRDIVREWDVPTRIGQAVGWGLQQAAVHAPAAGAAAAKAFYEAWKASKWWTQLLSALYIAKKAGGGAAIAKIFGIMGARGPGLAGSMVNPIVTIDKGVGSIRPDKKPPGGILTWPGKIADKAKRGAKRFGGGLLSKAAIAGSILGAPLVKGGKAVLGAGGGLAGGAAAGLGAYFLGVPTPWGPIGGADPAGLAPGRERSIVAANNQARYAQQMRDRLRTRPDFSRSHSREGVVIHSHVNIDGKEVARAVGRNPRARSELSRANRRADADRNARR